MKKIFSLLCATLLVFSASAAPVAKKAELAKKAPVAVEQMQSVQFENAQLSNLNQLTVTPALKVNNFTPQAPARAINKAPKGDAPALADRYDATGIVSTDGGTSWEQEPAWVATTGADQYGPAITNLIPKGPFKNAITLNYEFVGNQIVIPATPLAQIDAQNLVFALDITDFVTGGSGDIVLDVAEDGSLSLPEANKNHMLGYINASFNPTTYAPVQMTGVYHIYANIAYSIAQPITERDTVDVISNQMTYYDFIASSAAVQYYAGADAGYYKFIITSKNASSVIGTFDVWAGGYSYAQSTVTGQSNIFQEGKFTVAETEEGIRLTGYVIGADEKYYRLNWLMPAGVLPSDTDAPFEYDFAWRDMSASVEEGEIDILAADGVRQMRLVLFTEPGTTEIPAGTYVISDTEEAGTALKSVGYSQGANPCYAATLVEEEGKLYFDDMWFLVEGTVTLSYDTYDKLVVKVAGKNSYGQDVTVTIKYEELTAKDTVTVADATFALYEDYMAKYGVVEFFGSNEEVAFDLYAYSDTIFGNFSETFDLGSCELYTADGILSVYDAYLLEVTAEGKNMTLKAEVLGSDTVLYVITATGYYGALDYDSNEEYEGEFAIEEAEVKQVTLSKENYIYIVASNTESGKVALAVKGELNEEGAIAAGEYTEVLACAGLNEDYSVTPSYAVNAEEYLWFIQSGKLTVYENGSMLFEGLNSYDKKVTAKIGVVTALNNINANKKAAKVIKNGMIVIEKDGKAYNVLGIAL